MTAEDLGDAVAQTDIPEHPFDVAVALEPGVDGTVRGRTRPDWANMVGPFGGITAATMLRAVEEHTDRAGTPIALTVNFVAPITDGEFDIASRLVCTNRTNQHWIVELSQDGAAKTTATAVFGTHRDTWADTEAVMPDAPKPDDCAALDLSAMVVWSANYDMRLVTGGMPDDGRPAPSSTTTVWVRDKCPRKLDFTALAAMCDVFYPRIFVRKGRFLPASTISLTTYFHADQEQLTAQGDGFVLATARAGRFSRGYFDQTAQIWGHRGELLAASHQIVYFKDQVDGG
jgi:acyl-CoA thioesterase